MGEREGVFLGEKEARDEVQALAEEEQLNWGRVDLSSSETLGPGELGSLPLGFLKAGCSMALAWAHKSRWVWRLQLPLRAQSCRKGQ